MSDDKVELDIDNIGYNDFEINIGEVDIDDPHNGKDITKMEISAREEHLVTYSKDDNSIVYWDIEKERVEFRVNVKLGLDCDLSKICISDNKKLAIDNESHLSK